MKKLLTALLACSLLAAGCRPTKTQQSAYIRWEAHQLDSLNQRHHDGR
jgi:nitrous oxide reductase accessory protein NosL